MFCPLGEALFPGQPYIAIAFFAGHFSSKPDRWLELSPARVIRKLHFRNHQAMVPPVVDIDLDCQIFPWQLVTDLAQSPAAGGWPQDGELFPAQSDFALFAGRAAADFERKRSGACLFSEADMAPTRFVCEITLRDLEMARAQNLDRQTFDQELPLDLTRGDVVWTAHKPTQSFLARVAKNYQPENLNDYP
jgi:hypothetical protein